MLQSLRFSSLFAKQTRLPSPPYLPITPFSIQKTISPSFSMKSLHHQQPPSPLSPESQPTSFLGFINGNNRTIQAAHSIWQQVLHKGDTVIDATCGNGHDTLALLNMVSDNDHSTPSMGCVYGFDIQKSAIDNTTSLLDKKMQETVKLFQLCHSRMEEVVPKGTPVKVVAFNLGYLPGGDKSIITVPERTLEALQAASRLVVSGGVITVMVYVGHAGGKEEYETVLSFASGLPAEAWVCSKFEMVNRPLAPVLVFIFKK